MNAIGLRVIIRRFLELFVINATLSAILAILNLKDVLETNISLTIGLIIAAIIFFVVNVFMQRVLYYILQNKKRYYISTLLGYALFALLGLILYKFTSDTVYTWLYATTKVIKYIGEGVATPFSAVLYFGINALSVFVAPIGMGWVFLEEEA